MEGFLARAEILGRAGHQPPLRQTTDGRFVTNISVYTNFAQNRADGNTIEVNDRHTIVVWDRLAELCAQHVRAGTRIYRLYRDLGSVFPGNMTDAKVV